MTAIVTESGIEIVISEDGMAYPITPCCGASGKGTMNAGSGVCCRRCYAEVDSIYGLGDYVVVNGEVDDQKLQEFLSWFGGRKAA